MQSIPQAVGQILACEYWRDRPPDIPVIERRCQANGCHSRIALFASNVEKVDREGIVLVCVGCAIKLARCDDVKLIEYGATDAASKN